MKLEDLRPSFTVYLISSAQQSLTAPGEVLAGAGYVCLYFNDLTSAFSEVFTNPPHFIIFDINDQKIDLKRAFKEIRGQLPETHLFLFAPLEARSRMADFYAAGVYDVLWTPPVGGREWIRAIDRASERDYFMYMNEQLQKGEGQKSDLGRMTELFRSLQVQTSASDCIQSFLEYGSKLLGDCSALYLRFIPLRKLLSATQAHALEPTQWKGIGVDLSEAPDFRWTQLREPQTLAPLREMVKVVFERSDFQAVPLEIAREISGVAVFFGHQPSAEALKSLSLSGELVQTVAGSLELEKRLHSLSIKDETTGVLNRNYFSERVAAEVTRSRRNLRPISLLLIAVDEYGPAVSQGGAEEGETVLRLLARVLEKHSRVNDILARTGSDEFALLLPDTDLQGGAIKAERLRRMIEGGDFSRVLRFTPKLTISIGVSEYPSICRDADELFETADEALLQVRQKSNRVCLAKAPESHTPDFSVAPKAELA